MSKDVECPYCGEELDIDHDDGSGYEENVMHEQQCSACNKVFTFTTSILFVYEAGKADCLNGGEHKLSLSYTVPRWRSQMECCDCDYNRQATDAEIVGKYPNAIKEREDFFNQNKEMGR